MSEYKNLWDFYRDAARLIKSGITLPEFHAAMLRVQEAYPPTDGSPQRLRQLATSWAQWPAFVPIRLHEVFAHAPIEHTDDYVLAMVGGLGGRHDGVVRAFMLRHDSELRDELFWRIFEVEGGGEISLANVDKYSAEDASWHKTVVDLTNDGTLDRARVLRSCLAALNRDFSSYRAGWFSRVYAALAPTPEEAAADQNLLRLCLASSVTATVSLGVTHLTAVYKVGRLDEGRFIEACGPALSGPKAAAVAVVRILAAVAGKERADLDAIADLLALGLGHPHKDVQRLAAKALTQLGLDDTVSSQRDRLAPAVAAELLPAVARAMDSGAADAGAVDPVPVPPVAAALSPWTDDDALERYAALLEYPDNAIEFELALAWLAATGHAAAILAPLAKRARKIDSGDGRFWIAALAQAAADPAHEFLPQTYWQQTSSTLIDSKWVSEAVGGPKPRPTEEESTVLPSLVTRLRAVAAILQGRAPRRELLATPTDAHGWIDADRLIERFRGYSEGMKSLLRAEAAATGKEGVWLLADLNQALLRVKPEERARAAASIDVRLPMTTDGIRIEWRSRFSNDKKPDGSPQWVWWDPVIHADAAREPSIVQPGLIPSWSSRRHGNGRGATDLVVAELALADPASTLPLVPIGVTIMQSAADEDAEHRAGAMLDALAAHPGTWTPETAQIVALGMAAKHADIRTRATELLAATIPVRLTSSAAAEGFAACHRAIVLTRWAKSFTDAATLAPAAVIDLLTALLPRLDQKSPGIGALVAVLLDESIRYGIAAQNGPLRDWLAVFKGQSAATKASKQLLALGGAKPEGSR